MMMHGNIEVNNGSYTSRSKPLATTAKDDATKAEEAPKAKAKKTTIIKRKTSK